MWLYRRTHCKCRVPWVVLIADFPDLYLFSRCPCPMHHLMWLYHHAQCKGQVPWVVLDLALRFDFCGPNFEFLLGRLQFGLHLLPRCPRHHPLQPKCRRPRRKVRRSCGQHGLRLASQPHTGLHLAQLAVCYHEQAWHGSRALHRQRVQPRGPRAVPSPVTCALRQRRDHRVQSGS